MNTARSYVLIGVAFLVALGCSSTVLDDQPVDPSDLASLTAIRVDPPVVTLEATASQPATQTYRAFGMFPGGEREITDLTNFHLDNPAVGSFSRAAFLSSTNQGGSTNVLAQAGSISGSAKLTVHFTASVLVPPTSGTPLPSDPASRFSGTPSASRAPQVVYPNDGVMMPPNIQRLEVHFKPGSAQNTLFQLSFVSPTSTVTTYTRCGAMVAGGCVFPLDPATYAYVAGSNAGSGPVSLQVRGGDDNGTGFGESAKISLQFAQEPVSGGLYYWTTSNNTGIMRVDFGSTNLTPSLFLSPAQNGFPTCVGCHAISRDGTKMVSSLGGQNDGRLVFIADMKAPSKSLLTLSGTVPASMANQIQFASFNPAGDRFVANYGDTATLADRHKLWMHDGTTGLRIAAESIQLTFEPDHPDWSPNGDTIAFSKVGIHQTSQRPFNCGLEIVKKSGTAWSPPTTVVPIVTGKNRYNPNFAPDASFFIYSESTCPGGNNMSADCDADADPSATTWAVAPMAGAKPVALAKAAAQGVMDTQAQLSDTYPRFSPFLQKQGSGRLFWVTISSRRKAGLRDPGSYTGGLQWLWMFAVDPDKVAAGQDGSYPGFFLPFQDLSTSNHIGQWTQKVVVGPG